MDITKIIYGFASEIDIILYCFWGIIILTALGWANVISRSIASSLMVSVGISGTFLGIFVALYPLDFGPNAINESIQHLLRGMTTAFVTSLMGLAGAVLNRFVWSLNFRKPPVSQEHKDISGKLEDIKNAIAGDGDSSLVTQMQKLREENREGFKKLDGKMEGLAEAIKGELVKSLEDLIKEIREIIAEQLTKSLENLIEKIEEALIKQFGKTFVEFNQGVQAIKKWQEEHKEHVEKITAAFTQATEGMQHISKSMSEIKASTETIPPTVEKLSELVRIADGQITELDSRLKAFSDMREKAEAAFPEIETRLKQIGDNLSKSVEGIEDMKETIEGVANKSKEAAKKITEDCTASIDKMLLDMRKSMENAQKSATNTIQESVNDNINEIRSKVKAEIEGIAKTWAENLIAVAERCRDAIKKIDGP